MLSGHPAFQGDTAIDAMTAILKEHPPELSTPERHIPPALVRIVDRCLEKSPAARFQSTRDLAFALEALSTASTPSGATETLATVTPVHSSRERLRSAAALLAAVVAGSVVTALGARLLRPASMEAPEVRLQMITPAGDPLSFAISPDGRTIVFAAASEEKPSQLWLRPLESDTAQPLPGTEGARSRAGSLVYRPAVTPSRQRIWFDRSGKEISSIGEPDTSDIGRSSVSPDGSAVALSRSVNGNVDIWLMETARGVLRRLTSDPAVDRNPVWSPDGNRIAFESLRKGPGDLYQKLASGAAPEELLLESPINKNIYDWSPDGRFIVYAVQDPKTSRDLWALPLDGDRKPFVVAERCGRGGRALLARWAVARLQLGRNGTGRGLREGVSGARWHHADFDQRRRECELAQ